MKNLKNKGATAGAVFSLLALGVSCDADPSKTNAGTETHWLMECDSDAQCSIGSCLCGLCTFSCEDEADCRQAPRAAQCASPSEATQASLCANDIERICLAAAGSGNEGSGGMAGRSGSGGTVAVAAGAGGSDTTADQTGTGASAGTGGNAGSGGNHEVPSTGGAAGSGGSGSLGGTSGSGGSSAVGGAESSGGTGGATDSGSGAGSGGAGATGGRSGSGGLGGTGGGASSGGLGGIGDGGNSGNTGSSDNGGGGNGGVAGTSGSSNGGVGGSGTVPEPPASQVVLFELDYTNFAWGARSEGYYVTRDGSLYRYSTGLASDVETNQLGTLLRRRETMTLDEITAKYGTEPELQTTVPQDELYAMHALVTQARAGTLWIRGACSDAGESELIAWLYDEPTSIYSPVMLHVRGDTAVDNDAPAAAELTAWLTTLTGGTEDDFCAPSEPMACFEEVTCTDTPPTCPNRYQGVADGCYTGDCVDSTSCSDVRSCDDCGSATCMRDADGHVYCSEVQCSSETCPTEFACSGTGEEVTCDCAASRLCAGGRAWCQGSAAEGFSCVAP